jgi:hypothetical protein
MEMIKTLPEIGGYLGGRGGARGGWLVRTKGMESNEATGFLVLDSVLLV